MRENANFKTKIAHDLYWVPANFLNNYKTKNNKYENEPHNLYELLCLFQHHDFQECYNDRILKSDIKKSLTWELFDEPEIVVEYYQRGHCAVFSLWLNYYLTKMYDTCGYIEIIRNKNKSWHVINYIYIDSMYYIIDPSVYIKKYAQFIPIEDGNIRTYTSGKLITGGIFQMSKLENFVSYYQKYITLNNSSYLFLKLSSYELPPFSISGIDNDYTVYYPQDSNIEIIGEYNKDIYKIKKTYMCVDSKRDDKY